MVGGFGDQRFECYEFEYGVKEASEEEDEVGKEKVKFGEE